MPTIEERCYGHEPAQSQLDTLKKCLDTVSDHLEGFIRNIDFSRDQETGEFILHQMPFLLNTIEDRCKALAKIIEKVRR